MPTNRSLLYHNLSRYDAPNYKSPKPKLKKARSGTAKVLGLSLIIFCSIIATAYGISRTPNNKVIPTSGSSGTTATKSASIIQPSNENQCASNSLSKVIIVSITSQHAWACQGTSQVYYTPVVTGYMGLVADTTPVGTFHIYSKQTNLYLNGSDALGTWHDYVNYWMPFLSNQYGQFGLHDATWRSADQFGQISPYSTSASHGCVELPLAAATWLFQWVNVGTTVTVKA